MSEERYERIYGDIEVVCIDHCKKDESRFFEHDDYDKFVNELNELSRENGHLKKEIERLEDFQETVYNVTFGRDDSE